MTDEMKLENKVLVVGTVVAGSENVWAVEPTVDGYVNELKIHVPDGTAIKAGERWKFEAEMATIAGVLHGEKTPITILQASKARKAKRTEPDINRGRLSGLMHNDFQIQDSDPDKRTMGWGLINPTGIRELITLDGVSFSPVYRFIAWTGHALKLAYGVERGPSKQPPADKGAEVTMEGHLRIREYPRQGKVFKMLELVADPPYCSVLKAGVREDFFEDFGDAPKDKKEAAGI
jgi:hypothetical protein